MTDKNRTDRQQMPREPSPQLLYDGTSVSGKRTAGQKIIMFVLILVALVMTFVVTALNSRRALQGHEDADGTSSAQFSDPSQLRSQLIEAARRKRAIVEPEPVQIDTEAPIPAPIQAPVQPKIIVFQPNPPAVQQQRRNIPRVTDTEREEAKRYHELRVTSLSSKSSVDGFEKSGEAAPSGTQSAGNYSYGGGLDGITAAQIQEELLSYQNHRQWWTNILKCTHGGNFYEYIESLQDGDIPDIEASRKYTSLHRDMPLAVQRVRSKKQAFVRGVSTWGAC